MSAAEPAPARVQGIGSVTGGDCSIRTKICGWENNQEGTIKRQSLWVYERGVSFAWHARGYPILKCRVALPAIRHPQKYEERKPISREKFVSLWVEYYHVYIDDVGKLENAPMITV